ncbi:MAG: SAM-dependent methyltransferase [Acidobacteria bacterium]|nr:SAM-dependent methyltransferase [Acidobacteriota bacterium]
MLVDEHVEKFIAEAEKGLADDTFVKLILSNYKGTDRSLQKISVRIIETKKGKHLMFQSRFDTRDTVKNFSIAEAANELRRRLSSGFRNAHLFTTGGDFQLDIGKRNSRLTTGKPTTKARPATTHDRAKRSFVDPNAFYLKALGIATDKGEIKPSQRDKWRQINKFIEILAGLIEQSELKDKKALKIVDMGSGKGYLTFAAFDYLQKPAREQGRNMNVESEQQPVRPRIQMTGVEQRPELIALCNDIAKAGNFDGLKFVHGTIADFDPGEIDILIALHACDTATDDALYKGIVANASIIIAAPCCHKEIRKQIKPPEMLAGILKHGIMLERTAETITDGLRSLLLEREGYKTKLFEFIATEHTPKNNMLVATLQTRHSNVDKIDMQIAEVKNIFGIARQYLEELLKS